MRASSTRRLLRSTRTPTEDLLPAPLMKSPSQCPGMTRSSTSGGQPRRKRGSVLRSAGIYCRRAPRIPAGDDHFVEP